MTDSGFETRLARGLRDLADDGLRPFDSREIAEAIVATRRGGIRRWRLLATPEVRRSLPLIATALLLVALLGLALAVAGSHPSRPLDAQRLAFIRNGDIWVANTDGTAARLVASHQPAGSVPSSCVGVQWSPDGSRLATPLEADLRQAPTTREIGLLDEAGTAVATINVEVGQMAMAWSPDGKRLAVFVPGAAGMGVHVFDREGRLERDIALPPQARPSKAEIPIPSVKWSPDGQALAISEWCPCDSASGHTWVIDVDGSDAREIRGPGRGNVISVGWSPDGARMAIASVDQDSGELWVAGADGTSAQRIATAFNPIVDISGWSPDGSWIAFEEGNVVDVVRADGSGEPIRFGVSSLGARWSERQRLFFLTAPTPPAEDTPAAWQGIGSIMVLDPAGGEPAVVIDRVDARSPFDIQ